MADGFRYLGDLSAAPPWFSVHMQCDACRVSWSGCWDNFECPKCGDGELPWSDDLAPAAPESGGER